MRLRFAALVLAATASCVWLGCTAFDDALLPERDAGGTSSGAPDATPSGCARAPVPNDPPDSGKGGGDIDVVLAVRSISLGTDHGRVDAGVGYDLDGVCTCAPDKPSCTPREGAPTHCDGDLGRDNGTAQFLTTGPAAGIDATSFANTAFQTGDLGIIARVQGYNGLPDDTDIVFSLYRSTGVPTGKPNFDDPYQAWKIDPTDLAIGATNLQTSNSSQGFVTNGQLVVPQFESSKIPFNGDSDIQLKQVSFTGILKKDEKTGRWNLENGIGVGRWPIDDALKTVAHIQDPFNSKQRICQNGGLFATVKSLVCNAGDLTVLGGQDNKGQPCNAISTAVQFTMVPAALGPIDPPQREDACAGVTIGGCD